MPEKPMTAKPKLDCQHESFRATVNVVRLLDSGRFSADVRVNCDRCGEPFCFAGLPVGLDLDGAAVSVDHQEARIAIYPAKTGPKLSPNSIRGYKVTLHA